MSFHKKLLLTYLLFIIFLVIILGGIFYRHSTRIFEENAYSNLTVISGKMSQQLENIIRPMDYITTELLSDSSFISSMVSLANVDRNDPKNAVYINDARQTITGALITYSIHRNFYRVSVFNTIGDFFTSNFKVENASENLPALVQGFKWRKDADDLKGKAIIISPYIDPWAKNVSMKVFAIARSVQWPQSGMGYIEVQQPYSELQKIFAVPDEDSTKVVAITKTGEIFYNSGITDSTLLSYYSNLAAKAGNSVSVQKNPVTGRNEIVVGSGSDYTGIKIVLAQDKADLLKPLLFTRNITILISIIIIIISFIYIYAFSKQLTKPIRELKEKMESTELENLPDKITLESTNNEIVALNKSFQRLRERLNEAVRREIKSQSLQMQASFDSLQAQVNPHFIYNILNVLSNKGIENGDDEICEICDSIASMLRYSTSTKKRFATIGEELGHVQNYLLLMKKRFEHRLEFIIDVDRDIYGEIIPKIVLQPIVENSINHGFEKGLTVMRINIRGYIADGCWYIEIIDNGQGFDPDVLNELEKRMKYMERELSGEEPQTGFAIGGMGLINTFGRLSLFYNNRFVFKLTNIDGGAKVTIGGAMGLKEEDDER